MQHISSVKKEPLIITLVLIALSVMPAISEELAQQTKPRTTGEIISQSSAADWRGLDQENSLYIRLKTGLVVVELAPQFAPQHVANTKALVRAGLFDNTSFYRVIDGFVAQGGPADSSGLKAPENGQLSIPAEFTTTNIDQMSFTPLNGADGYADEVGYVDGFASARNSEKTQAWLTHCYGAFAMGRANAADSGGTELYVVIGQAQRYLDRNTTVFGRVITGMEHLQQLQRSASLNGPVDVSAHNTIVDIKVGSDLEIQQQMPIEIMKTNALAFKDLILARKNRSEDWFVYAQDYVDVCGVAVPMRLKKEKE
ncbi:peptidylprolyl isomerase [Marinicella sp. W31]|uniref:peptidylprolyl isomerase n=1 Tax=Marinicella sp. W31 TaxID=3023713 RepID=UPI0037565BB6